MSTCNQSSKMNSPKFQFDVLFFRRFYCLLRIMFPKLFSITVLLFILLLTITSIEEIVTYSVGMIASRFYGVLANKDMDKFKIEVARSFAIICGQAALHSVDLYCCSLLYISWRRFLCKFIHQQYFQNIFYYDLNIFQDKIDNVDQRITQDVDKLCQQFSNSIATIIISPFTIAYYSYAAYIRSGYLGPLGIFIYFIFGTIINKVLMSPVVQKVVEQEKKEGEFRFKHVQIRVNAEPLAFYHSGLLEAHKTNIKLEDLLQTQTHLANRQFALNISCNMFDYLGSILSYLVLAIPIFGGFYNNLKPAELASLISENAFVCIYLITSFSKLVDLSGKVTDIAGTAHRIGEVLENLQLLKDEKKQQHIKDSKRKQSFDEESSDASKSDIICFKISNLSVAAPNSEQLLIKELNLQISAKQNILIQGSSGCGKTSLLRVLAGLWKPKSGVCKRYLPRESSRMMFLPQRPYFTNGSLRDQIMYPLSSEFYFNDQNGDSKIMDLMEIVKLVPLLERIGSFDMDIQKSWYDVLSPGEMQRLCFVRLFYHQPCFAFLDEATSAVEMEVERVLYAQSRRLDITMITVGYRTSLNDYHDCLLSLDGHGGWTLTSLK